MKILVGESLGSYVFDATAKTITLSGLGTLTLEQIVAVVNVVDNIILYNPVNSLTGGSISSNVLTLTYDTSLMSDTDNLFILVEIGEPQIDFALSALKNIVQNPISNEDTDVEDLVSALTISTFGTWSDVGDPIDMRGKTELNLFVNLAIGAATDFKMRALGQTTFAGGATDEYTFMIETVSASDIKIEAEYIEFNTDADQLVILKIKSRGVPYIQLQADGGTDGGTDPILTTVKLNKLWR